MGNVRALEPAERRQMESTQARQRPTIIALNFAQRQQKSQCHHARAHLSGVDNYAPTVDFVTGRYAHTSGSAT